MVLGTVEGSGTLGARRRSPAVYYHANVVIFFSDSLPSRTSWSFTFVCLCK